MEGLFTLEVMTPDREFYRGEVSMVEMTTTEGQIGVYKGHIPLTAIAAPGILRIHEDGEKKEAALISGFVRVMPDSVTILADVVEWPEDIDTARAGQAKDRAERRIRDGGDELDLLKAQMALHRALTRLSAGKHRNGRNYK